MGAGNNNSSMPPTTTDGKRSTQELREPERTLLQKLLVPLFMLVIFWGLAISLWRASGQLFFVLNFGYIGTSIALGMGLLALLPRKRKSLGRRLTLFLVGGYMLGFLGLLGHENMQIEGFWLYLLGGVFAGATMHYLVAKIIGPLIFGRAWCGWACWTAMVLDLLPHRQSPGRVAGGWGNLRYVHFALSLGLVSALWFGFDYRLTLEQRSAPLYWLMVGNLIYYASGLGLAFALRDNRAFCKYLCPITAFLKTTSRFSLMKIKGNATNCTGCGACARQCPMDIRIPEYIQAGRRVQSTECILCQSCIHACPTRTLKLSFGFDLGGRELLCTREADAKPSAEV